MNPFPSRDEREYDWEALSRFPWPVTAGYDLIHRWMDESREVHAAWQVRDAWEAFIKFLGTLCAADVLAAETKDEERLQTVFELILKRGGLSLGDWAELMRLTLTPSPVDGAKLPELGELLFRRGKPTPLMRMMAGGSDSFVAWRNRRFGHGVFQKDLSVYAEEALTWLTRLHDAFDWAEEVLDRITLEGELPNGDRVGWGADSPFPQYHQHEPVGRVLDVTALAGQERLTLSPLLNVQQCRVCGQWEAFYFDRYQNRQKRAWFLDFLQGHSQERRDVHLLVEWMDRVEEPPEEEEVITDQASGELYGNFVAEFEPPLYLAQKIAEFIQTNNRGVILVTGGPGVGKSWLSMGLDHAGSLPAVLDRTPPALRVGVGGVRPLSGEAMQSRLMEQAKKQKSWRVPGEEREGDPFTKGFGTGPIKKFGLEISKRPKKPASTPAGRFSDWLQELMYLNGHGELLIAIDGLDELPQDSDLGDMLPDADLLPHGCYLICSGRPELRGPVRERMERYQQQADRFSKYVIDENDPAHREVLQRYTEKHLTRRRSDGETLPTVWANALVEKAKGSFLYVHHYCAALHLGMFQDVDGLPEPSAYYPAFFEHLRARVGDEFFEQVYARALALLAVAREPLSVSHLTSWGIPHGKVQLALQDLSGLLQSIRHPWEPETLYVLGHDDIREYLSTSEEWRKRQGDAERFLVSHALARFGDDWSQADSFNAVDYYLLAHLLHHSEADAETYATLLGDERLALALIDADGKFYDAGLFAKCLYCCETLLSILDHLVYRFGRSDLWDSIAWSIDNRALVLSRLGSLEDALVENHQAIEIGERLVNEEGRSDLRPNLANSYNNRAAVLYDLGRLEEALVENHRAIEIGERLVNEEGRDDLQPALAHSYNNRAAVLHGLGRFEEALAEFLRAIEIGEWLVNEKGHDNLQPDLAVFYSGRARELRNLGCFEEALVESLRAIEIRERLVNEEGRDDLQSDLANSYNNRANVLRNLGRFEEALADINHTTEIRERLVNEEGRGYLRPDLATSYHNRALVLHDLGHFEEALAEQRRVIEIREQLVNEEGRVDLRPDRVTSYHNRALVLHDLGRLEDALTEYQRAIEIGEQLVNEEGRGELQPNLTLSYHNRALVLRDLGYFEEALADINQATEIQERLVNEEGRSDLRPDLATSYHNRALVLRDLGRFEDALTEYKCAIEIGEQLVNEEGRGDLQPNLANSYNNRTNVLRDLGHFEEALAEQHRAIEIRERLVNEEGRGDLRPDLATSYHKRAVMLQTV